MKSAEEFDKERIEAGIGLREICREAGIRPPTYYYGLNVAGGWTYKIFSKLSGALNNLKGA